MIRILVNGTRRHVVHFNVARYEPGMKDIARNLSKRHGNERQGTAVLLAANEHPRGAVRIDAGQTFLFDDGCVLNISKGKSWQGR